MPQAWRGAGRAAAWRRLRARRVAAALVVGIAAYVALGQVLHALQLPTRPVVVALTNVPAGARVQAGDVGVRELPASSVPAAAESDPGVIIGGRVTAALSSGEVVTRARVRVVPSVPGLTGGVRAVHVPVVDTAGLAWVRAGDHVDIHRASDGARVGANIAVLAVDGTASGWSSGGSSDGSGSGSVAGGSALSGLSGLSASSSSGVVLAVPSEEVPAITRAAYSGTSGSGTSGSGVLLALRATD